MPGPIIGPAGGDTPGVPRRDARRRVGRLCTGGVAPAVDERPRQRCLRGVGEAKPPRTEREADLEAAFLKAGGKRGRCVRTERGAQPLVAALVGVEGGAHEVVIGSGSGGVIGDGMSGVIRCLNRSGAQRRSILIGYFAESRHAAHLASAHLRNVRMDTSERFEP